MEKRVLIFWINRLDIYWIFATTRHLQYWINITGLQKNVQSSNVGLVILCCLLAVGEIQHGVKISERVEIILWKAMVQIKSVVTV